MTCEQASLLFFFPLFSMSQTSSSYKCETDPYLHPTTAHVGLLVFWSVSLPHHVYVPDARRHPWGSDMCGLSHFVIASCGDRSHTMSIKVMEVALEPRRWERGVIGGGGGGAAGCTSSCLSREPRWATVSPGQGHTAESPVTHLLTESRHRAMSDSQIQ